VGLVLALPGLFGSALDPLIGLAGNTRLRGTLVLLGGIGLAVSTALSAAAFGFWTLLVALLIGNPAVGAFVSLAQASLMDSHPAERDRNMARWTLAGSVGYVAGPVLIAGGVWVGLGWRGVLLGLAAAAVPLAFAGRRACAGRTGAAGTGLRTLLSAVRRREVLRWLGLLEAADLLLDVFHGFLALYFVDVVNASPVDAALAVAVWTGAGLVGDAALLIVLRRFSGLGYLRASGLCALAAYPAFLAVPSLPAKLGLLALLGLLNSGWYALPKAGLYSALPGESGTAVAVAGFGGLAGAAVPAGLGFLAEQVGLGPTMWLLLLAPAALVAGVPRPFRCRGGRPRDRGRERRGA
jgi:FSR family fosmidomycin resistance protein-like MFS transporter